MRRKLKFILLLSLAMSISALLGASLGDQGRAISNDSMAMKVYSGLLYRCYRGNSMKNKVEYSGNDNILNDTIFTPFGTGTNTVHLPNGWSDEYGDDVTCQIFFEGLTSASGSRDKLKGMNYTKPSNNSEFLNDLGYVQTDGGGSTCINFGYDVVYRDSPGSDGNIISSESGKYNIFSNICLDVSGPGGDATITGVQNSGTSIASNIQGDGIDAGISEDGNLYIDFTGTNTPEYISVDILGAKTVNGLINEINARLGEVGDIGSAGGSYKYLTNGNNARISVPYSSGAATGTYTWRNNNVVSANLTASEKLLGTMSRELTDSEVASIYMDYINRYMTYNCNPNSSARPADDTMKVRLKINGAWNDDCYITSYSRETFNGVDSSNVFGVQVNVMDIINYFKSDIKDDDDATGLTDDTNLGKNPTTPITDLDPNDGENSESSTDDVCYGSPGTLGLSWILCPITQMLYDTLDKVYNTVEDNFLQLDSKELLGQKTRDAWQIFQQVANIVFVIFLLVVIFSQLTGIGIDNYGVKKILPRLIICAILVNLSYFIAQILVDISNIIGVGIKNLFESLASGGVASTDPSVVGEGGGYTLMVAGIAIVVATVYANPALLLGFLLTLLTGVISVVMLLAILVAREVGVVVAVIIAPLAFVSYMLPNTSRWLKSWGNLLKGLLIVYPLAAALIGASAFVSGILPSQDNQWMALAAMLVRVVPFFMLPTLFRKSMDAVGNLGTRIQGFGRGIGTGLTRRVTQGEGYRNLQKTSLERRNRIRAGVNQEGELNTLGRARARLARSGIGRRFGYDSLEAARVARARKAREEDISSAAELGGAIMRSDLARNTGDSRQNYLTRELRDAANAGDTNAFFAALDQAQKSGMKSSDIAKITRELFITQSDWGGSLGNEGGFGNFLQEFANRYSGTFLKKDAEQKAWAATRGGLDVNVTTHPAARGGLSGFASRGGMETADLKDNEIIDLSAERLHELLSAGIIDQAQAQRVWSSGANMDSVNKLMLGAMGTRGELINKGDAQAMTSATYSGGLHGLNRQAVQALTEATPQDTVIRDVRWKNENGETRQTNPLWTTQNPNANNPTITFVKDIGNGQTINMRLEQQPDGTFIDPNSGRRFSENTLSKGGYRRS